MDIRTLRYFLAVARLQHITKAAEFLHISQPSLSVQIQNLEAELGKPLLKRVKHRISLTAEGELFCKRAEEKSFPSSTRRRRKSKGPMI